MSVFIGYPSFMAYQMMKGKKGNNDGFPSIPGMIARYSALGLTNEQMSTNPVWVDKTGNGHDIQLKNFSWKGMSGVGGYKFNFLSNEWIIDNNQVSKKYSYKIVINNKRNSVQLHNRINLGHIKITLKITGIEINKSTFRVYDNVGREHAQDYTKDGIYEIDYTANEGANIIYFYVFGGNMGQLENPITIEQLPLYPGALVFDGVDDYGTCDNFPILTKEKGYTVVALRQFLGSRNSFLISNQATGTAFSNGAFVFERFWDESGVIFYNFGTPSDQLSLKPYSPFSYLTSKSYNGRATNAGDAVPSNTLLVGKSIINDSNSTNAAVWEICILDHDATEEELTKIKDYFVKTYPWLFPDRAWTVVGKTNEDEDRATIANITGNGNDLVLSNFRFAEGSGYGLYAYNFNSFNLRDNVVKPTDVKKDSFRIIGTGNSSNVLILTNESDSANWKIRITGMKEGDSCIVGNANKSDDYIKIIKDGIYTFQKQYAATSVNGIWYNSSQEVDVLVEQIPEYEGYLVTDGVDDSGRAVGLTISKDFTLVGEWILFSKTSVNAGLSIHPQIHIFNRPEAIRIMFRTADKTLPVKSLKAICSDGRCYDENWSELKINVGEFTDNRGVLFVASNGTNYAQIAFKNLGIYNNQILSKNDCIKAYNYLQTLKTK